MCSRSINKIAFHRLLDDDLYNIVTCKDWAKPTAGEQQRNGDVNQLISLLLKTFLRVWLRQREQYEGKNEPGNQKQSEIRKRCMQSISEEKLLTTLTSIV